MGKWIRRGILVAVAVFVAIQFVPYGWSHSNPPVIQDAPWPNEQAAEIARVSCYDCHSNETDWPIYSYVAPMSWLVRQDVDEGRDELNFSDWDDAENEVDDAIKTIEDAEMPPSQYTVIHGDARLTNDEQRILITALQLMDDDD